MYTYIEMYGDWWCVCVAWSWSHLFVYLALACSCIILEALAVPLLMLRKLLAEDSNQLRAARYSVYALTCFPLCRVALALATSR